MRECPSPGCLVLGHLHESVTEWILQFDPIQLLKTGSDSWQSGRSGCRATVGDGDLRHAGQCKIKREARSETKIQDALGRDTERTVG